MLSKACHCVRTDAIVVGYRSKGCDAGWVLHDYDMLRAERSRCRLQQMAMFNGTAMSGNTQADQGLVLVSIVLSQQMQ